MSSPVQPPLRVETVDGTTSGRPITTIKVTNGDLTISGSTATIDTSGAGGGGTVTSVGTSQAFITITNPTSTPSISIGNASGAATGVLTASDFNTFDAKQDAITLTTTGTSGAATFSAGTLNIPQYSGSSGTVTSVALTESGNALTVTGSPITGSGTLNISGAGSSSQVILGDLTLGTLTSGTVTSVALTESGNALTVTGSPITGSGTLNISGAGSSSQVILGDLTLATLPTGTIGGSSTANQVSFGDTTANEITSSSNFQFLSNQNLYVGGRIQIGNGTGTKLTTVSSQDLILDTNEGTDSGNITIQAGTNGQISITPDGTGIVKIDGVGINNSAIATGYILKATSTTEAGWVAESGGGFTGSLADTQVAFGNTTADSIQGSSSLTVTGSGSSFQLNNSGGYKAKNGTPSAPAYHMTGDADTGMYLITNGRLGFATNGERQVQIRDAHMTLGGNGYSTEFIIDAEGSTQDLSLRSGGGDAGGVQYAEILLQPDNGNIEVRPEGTGKIQFHDAYTFPTAVTAANDYVLTAQTDGTTAWAASGGGGGGIGGSITDNQVAVGATTADEIEGSADFTYNASTDTLTVGEKIDSSGTSPLLLVAGSSVISVLDGGVANHINISPASGRINLQSSTLSVGTGLSNTTISSSGAYDLTLNTNDGTNSGSIAITDGVDGNITLAPNGAGAVVFRSPRVSSFDTPASASAAGVTGSLAYDENYIYVCTATDTWKRVALSTW
jgi:hypothetical protein